MSDPGGRSAAGIDLWDLVAALRRRVPWLVAGLLAGLALGAVAFELAPKQYRSEATLLVESRWFPQEFLQNPLGKSMRERLQTLQHRLTADRVLAQIARDVGPERLGAGAGDEAGASALRAGFQFEIADAASPDSAVVRVAYVAPDPELARDVASALSHYAVEERRREAARQAAATAEVLRDELDELRGHLAEKSERLAQLAARSPSVAPDVNEHAEQQRNERLAELQSLQTLEAEVARAESRYTPKHPVVLQLRSELQRQRRNLVAPAPRALLPASGDAAPSAEYRSLLREYESNLQTYESLLARRIDATMAERLERTGAVPEIQVLREPRVPARPSAPDPLRFLGAGAGAGLALAALLAGWPALRRPTFRSVEQLGELSGLPVVAAVPLLRAAEAAPALAPAGSTTSEQFRRILPYLSRGKGTPVVLVTGAERGAGSSRCAAHMAAVAAVDGQRRTLLIDADLRSPALAARLGLPAGPGLAECARGETSLASAALPTRIPNLFLLRAGDAAGSPVAAFEDERLAKLLEAARREFSAVFVDAPPRLALVDAALLERLATILIFVVRADATPRASVMHALRGVELPVGLILNGVTASAYRQHFGRDPEGPPVDRGGSRR